MSGVTMAFMASAFGGFPSVSGLIHDHFVSGTKHGY